jgi:NAD(P)-dependent dehydrogenase (short-subunit alcohol dehydrogenase family)
VNLDDIRQLYDFTGRVVVVTGGAGVLGGEMACALVGCGAHVVILDRDPALADAVLARLPEGPGAGRASVVFGDVLRPDVLSQAVATVEREIGPVAALINAAGGNRPEATTSAERRFFDLPPEALRAVTDLNLLGTVLACQAFGRPMAERGAGVILNITSMAALRPLTRVASYSAAKAAVVNFTQWLAVHMAQEYSPAIRVNAVAPGFFRTEQNRYLLTDAQTGALTPRGEAIIAHTPMGRFGQPEDLLGAVLWLLSPAAAFVTGIVVPVDGGFSAYAGV